ncbi:MAG: hypothetical protein LDL07_11095 [Desulfarculus sp.]|nr:hypothetical protein [Desulfarculus sp.]
MEKQTISLTDFVDFVVKTGQPKLTKIKEIANREPYHPRRDFWKMLRDGIIDFHTGGGADKSILDNLCTGLTDKNKQKRYPEAVAGYKQFLGRKKYEWFQPPTAKWEIGKNFFININPELGLTFNNKSLIIKLYFKDEKLTQQKCKTVLFLMDYVLRKHANPYCLFEAIAQKGRGFSCQFSALEVGFSAPVLVFSSPDWLPDAPDTAQARRRLGLFSPPPMPRPIGPPSSG